MTEVLTFVGDSKDVYEGYPLGDHVDIKVQRIQKTLDQKPESSS